MIKIDNLDINLKKIIPVDWLEGTPARVYRPTGVVFLDRRIWNTLTPSEQKFILLHEAGHHELNTANEIEADNYAINKYKFTEPLSLKNSIKVLSKFLDPTNPAHEQRLNNLINQALYLDFTEKGNLNALNKLLGMNPIQEKIKQIQVNYLLRKGIKNVASLSEAERLKIADETMNLPEMVELMATVGNNFSDLTWLQKLGRGVGKAVKAVGKVVAPVAGVVLAGLGLPVAGAAVNAIVNKAEDKVEQKQEEIKQTNVTPPPITITPAPNKTPVNVPTNTNINNQPVYEPSKDRSRNNETEPNAQPTDKILGMPKTVFYIVLAAAGIGLIFLMTKKSK